MQRLGNYFISHQPIKYYNSGARMENNVQALKSRIDTLETELNAMRRTLGATMQKKDPKAWERLHTIGKKLTREWKSKKQSWQLISEARR
jgi:Skp family chaperone for outer membrane proteins